ncbi:MAG: class III signal peptide-containing protein [Candidatus Diapherotrites archaeon]
MSRGHSANHSKGQGALEYLLLIGGAVLVATIVLGIVFQGIYPATENQVSAGLGAYQQHIVIDAAFGDPDPFCGDGEKNQPSEYCDSADLDGSDCISLGYSSGSLSCNANCTYDTSSCSGGPSEFCGNNVQEGTEDCDGSDLGGNDCTTISGSYTGGTLSCNVTSCTFDTSSCTTGGGSDTTPPSGILFSVIPGDAQVDATFSATELDTLPIVYEIGYATTASGTISSFSATSNGTGNMVTIPTTTSPLPITGLTNGTQYSFILRACDSVTPIPNCAISSPPVTATPSAPAGFSSLAVSSPSLDSTPGYLKYTFTWTGSSFTSGIGANTSGIAVVNGLSFPVSKGALDPPVDALLARSPVASPHPSFSPSNGASVGNLSNAFIKNLFLVYNPLTAPVFGIVGDVTSDTQYQLASNTPTGTFLVDDEAPGPLPTPSVSTGVTNGGVIDLSWTEPLDNYLGATYSPSTTDYRIVYDSSLITAGSIPAIIGAGKTKTGSAAGNTVVNQSIDYQTGPGLVPSQPYYSAVLFCDKLDGVSAYGYPNCALWASSSPTTSSKEALIFEPETWTLQSGLQSASYNSQQVIDAKNGPTICTAANNTATYTITGLKAPASVPTTYKVWIRGANAGTGASGGSISFGGSTPSYSFPANSPFVTPVAFTWVPASSTLPITGTSANVILTVNCDMVGVPNKVSEMYVDKVLITTDATCTPTGDGSNCQ